MDSKLDKKWPRCLDHQDCPYQFVWLTEKQGKQRLLCSECLFVFEQLNKNKDYDNTIPLSYIIRQPEILINQIQNDQRKNYLKHIFKYNEQDLNSEFTKLIEKFELILQTLSKMKDEIQQSYKEYQLIQEEFKKCKNSFLEVSQIYNHQKCQLNKLSQLINDLKDLDKQFKSEQYKQIQGNINSTLDEILKGNGALISHNTNDIAFNHNFLKKLSKSNKDLYKQQVVTFFQEYDDYICSLNKMINSCIFTIPELKILNKDFFLLLLQKMEKETPKYINKMNLLYEGCRDVSNKLETKTMWNKIYGKKNLLVILKSEKDEIFGGYSPCQWKSCQGSFAQDDALAPFLFQQSQQKFYSIKKEMLSQAFDCTSNSGPNFGLDLQIKANFDSCSSVLGSSYQLDPEYQDQSNTLLFGELSPTIIQVEIYELVFT